MMVRCLAVSVLSIALAAGVCAYRDSGVARPAAAFNPEDPDTAPAGPLRERLLALREQRQRRDAFARVLERVTDELARGTAGLRGATDRLFFYCLQNYPEHLENVQHAEGGPSFKASLARNLVRGVRMARETGEGGAATDEALGRLEGELREMSCDGSGPAPPPAGVPR